VKIREFEGYGSRERRFFSNNNEPLRIAKKDTNKSGNSWRKRSRLPEKCSESAVPNPLVMTRDGEEKKSAQTVLEE